ncbi:Xylose isomerase domain-containing protein TIM barrel [Rhodomicrobium vannielii ATCC 17100]|uniref:Xylose isomerase domain-containing protein TIM barrel n=1 Tax=Rhodomicrobium vannielii (strain ATCC 17100 / DSM 162 / LMG 4299 / NCIMB 10020 / ATH 3.1.1) TaxID=648757 RepID=E3I589_RHOVT|nr:TIM barrel protein [Rhodomicrobium vannielii]ADP70539.1 Xylose isomerase domain-containing protein TIM barrel [Rhodomicrobium vannielii ATCC 17100]
MAAVRGAGFSSAVRDDYQFEILRRNLDQAQELGVDFVEIPIFAMDLIAGGRVIQSQMRRLKEALRPRALSYTAHGPIAVNFMQRELSERHFDVARASVEAAAEIGAAHVVFHTGVMKMNDTGAIEAAYSNQRDYFAKLGDVAAEHGIIVAVENVFATAEGETTALPSRLAHEIEAIGHPSVLACLDFSHGAITCAAQGADFLAEAEALARVAIHLHIHDSFGDPTKLRTYSDAERLAYGIGDLHAPIGWGNLPWQEMMKRFTFRPDVIFNLELPPRYWYALDDSVREMHEMIEVYKAGRANA